MSNIFNPENGAAYDASGKKIESPVIEPVTVDAPPVVTEVVATTDTPPVTTAVTPTSVEINWEERTGGKFKSWDEIQNKLTEAPTAQELTFENEESRKLAQYLKEGKLDDVRQVLNDQYRLSNLDKLSDAEAIKLNLEFKNAHFDQKDIAGEFEAAYVAEKPEAPVEDDYIDDDAYKVAVKSFDKELKAYEKQQAKLNRQLKLDAQEARTSLGQLKSHITLPDISIPQPANVQTMPDEATLQEQAQEAAKWKNLYDTSLEKSANEFTAIPFKINDEGVNIDVSYAIDPTEVSVMKKDLMEKDLVNDVLLSRYIKGDAYDTNQLVSDVYFLNNREKIINNIVKQAIAQDRKAILAGQKNVNLDGQQRGDFTPNPQADLTQFSKEFFNVR
jgi:hypothetical protein